MPTLELDTHIDTSKMEVSDEVAIQITDMNKWYGTFHVLRDIDLTVYRGERIVICGPSGSGKSTLIRCINRLEEHQQGSIVVDGNELNSDLKNVDKVRSEVGMVFQHFNLFPHLTILENCTSRPSGCARCRARKRSTGPCISSKGEDPRSGEQVPRPVVGRPAAARRHRPVAVHDAADHAVRRADSALDPEMIKEVLDTMIELAEEG